MEEYHVIVRDLAEKLEKEDDRLFRCVGQLGTRVLNPTEKLLGKARLGRTILKIARLG